VTLSDPNGKPRALPPSDPPTPFTVGPPILHPHRFFEREPLIRRLFQQIRQPPLQNAVIIGPRRSGKTSLLYYLQTITRTPADQVRPGQRTDWLAQPERYRWVMVDFQDARVSTRAGLLRYLLNSLELAIPDSCTLDRFLEVMSDGVQQPTVILLDEIGKALQRYPDLDDDLWESLRSLGPQVGGNLGFVLATHTSPMQLAHDNGHSSPFFNIFGYTTRLGPFSEAAARELIASSPIPFPEADVAWMLAQSGRWPILLQVLCRERLASLEAGEAGDAWREEALQQMEPFLPYTEPPAVTTPTSPPEPLDRATLRQLLNTHFSESELRDLCFDLGLDDESLPGPGKNDKVRELIRYCERHSRVDELVTMCRKLRPHALI
jgi:hypothetical protein